MVGYLFKKLGELLLPERQIEDGMRYLEPVKALSIIHRRISQLAQQIDSHADLAPYPQVAEQLRQIAGEKRDSASHLRKIIEKLHGSIIGGMQESATANNHWQRLIRDLEDQTALDDFLSRSESNLTRHVPEVSDFLRQLKTIDEAHKRSLTQQIAVADPQATQT